MKNKTAWGFIMRKEYLKGNLEDYCGKTFEIGDWVQYIEKVGHHSIGDTSKVLYVSGEYLDLEDDFGGKRGKKGRKGIQRVKKYQVKIYD